MTNVRKSATYVAPCPSPFKTFLLADAGPNMVVPCGDIAGTRVNESSSESTKFSKNSKLVLKEPEELFLNPIPACVIIRCSPSVDSGFNDY